MTKTRTEDKMARVLVVRVQEWAAWFLMHEDPTFQGLVATVGETAIEIRQGEELQNVEAVPTNQTRYFPVDQPGQAQPINVQKKLIVFRATLTRIDRRPRDQAATPRDPAIATVDDSNGAKTTMKKIEMPPGADR